MGAGMFCVEGSGAFSNLSLRHHPQIGSEPMMFAALKLANPATPGRLLQGPVPEWKILGTPRAGNGARGSLMGFPRFEAATLEARFPFATLTLSHADIPLECQLMAWSPFLPGNADDSSLPLAVLEYGFENQTSHAVEAVFSFHCENVMATGDGGDAVEAIDGGFALLQSCSADAAAGAGAMSVTCLGPEPAVDCSWFRGGWYDTRTMLWSAIEDGQLLNRPPPDDGSSPGGSLYVPICLAAEASVRITVLVCWHVPASELHSGQNPVGEDCCDGSSSTHVPWYAGRFESLYQITEYAHLNYDRLRRDSVRFRDCFYDTTLPAEVVEAVAANLSILKSPTVLRQADGRLWCWEGCADENGCCAGSCTHVWNYAQALPHLFPDLERGLREIEFNESQDQSGHQAFRAALPIRLQQHEQPAAADGQLGGIMKVYREWRISGDTAWMKGLWPRVRASLDYCIDTWDPERKGVLVEPHHNTYDIEFWGPDGMCSSFYLGALAAATAMGHSLGAEVSHYEELLGRGKSYVEEDLFNGDYFVQQVQWTGLRAGDPTEAEALVAINWSPEALQLAREEGPKYQYGNGCLADGVLGAWLATVCGVGEILDGDKARSHLLSVHRHNLKSDLSSHANPQRPGYAAGTEGGLLLCTWPNGGKPSLPFVYSDEVWTGIEYQVASHLMLTGFVEQGLEIVRTARSRYDGRVRNPFDEYECGHWYARALASYALLQGLSGVRYDAVDRVLHVKPSIAGDFRSFLSTATGYGTAGVASDEPFLEVIHGSIEPRRIEFVPCRG